MADKKSFVIGKASVPYLMTTYLMERIIDSRCGYAVVDKERYSLRNTEKSILALLRQDDANSFRSLFSGEDYKKMKQEARDMEATLMKVLETKKFDDKTACGLIVGQASSMYILTLKDWNKAVKIYSQ